MVACNNKFKSIKKWKYSLFFVQGDNEVYFRGVC